MKYVCHAMLSSMLLLALSSGVSAQNDLTKEARSTAFYYLDLLAFRNIESAEGLWVPSAVERANRLGIEYENIIFKPDCNSPAVYCYDQLKEYFVNSLRTQSPLDTDAFLKIKFDIKPHEKRYEYFYYMQLSGEYFWFTFAEDYYAREWSTRKTKFFRVHVHPRMSAHYNDFAANALDRFVETVAERLTISKDRLKILEEQKIDYFLCERQYDIDNMCNTKADNFYNQASDAVFSVNFPDFQIVARPLVNFHLQTLPYATVPFLRDGLAVYLGGSWQRSAPVLLDFGEYLLHNRVVEIDSLLVPSDSVPPFDLTSPASAVLVDYLVQKLGWETFFAQYRELSGSVTDVDKLSALTIKRSLAKYLKDEWRNIIAAINAHADNRDMHGGAIFPGIIKTNKKLLNDSGLVVSRSDDWVQIEYTAPAGSKPDLALFFGKSKELFDKKSSLRDEQYDRDPNLIGYRFSVRVDKNEIGLYDYATNQLVAKYVYDFDPDDNYYDKKKNHITAYFDIRLLDGILPQKDDCLILRGN
ncbi:MAG: hypothetical protein JW763_09040 [candidate division Zixibacteria bacterium]|nr:hypothetical protein [candidate division Zixibacteria bacterium]